MDERAPETARATPDVDAEAVKERATVDHYEPPVHGLERPMWIAEDPETGCWGLGRVRDEAVGNLVAVVAECGDRSRPYMKVPGSTVQRVDEVVDRDGLLDRLRNLL